MSLACFAPLNTTGTIVYFELKQVLPVLSLSPLHFITFVFFMNDI